MEKTLADNMGSLVNKYFYDRGWGRCIPVITYNTYDIRKYTFRMCCQTRNASDDFCVDDDLKMNDFRKEARKLLKQSGFTKCKFDTIRKTIIGGAFGDYKVIQLIAIYFDK